MKVGDLVRDRRHEFRHEIGVIKRIDIDIDGDGYAVVLWANGHFAGDTSEEMFEYLEVMENPE
jgi:hypothetical protein